MHRGVQTQKCSVHHQMNLQSQLFYFQLLIVFVIQTNNLSDRLKRSLHSTDYWMRVLKVPLDPHFQQYICLLHCYQHDNGLSDILMLIAFDTLE